MLKAHPLFDLYKHQNGLPIYKGRIGMSFAICKDYMKAIKAMMSLLFLTMDLESGASSWEKTKWRLFKWRVNISTCSLMSESNLRLDLTIYIEILQLKSWRHFHQTVESWCFFTLNFLCWTYFDKVGVDHGQLVFAASKVQFRICGFDSTKQAWFLDYYQLHIIIMSMPFLTNFLNIKSLIYPWWYPQLDQGLYPCYPCSMHCFSIQINSQ